MWNIGGDDVCYSLFVEEAPAGAEGAKAAVAAVVVATIVSFIMLDIYVLVFVDR